MIRVVGICAVAVLTVLSACGEDDPRSGPEPSGTAPGDYSVELDSYCQVQYVRAQIASGALDRSDLPDFADQTEVDGTPRVIDFTRPPERSDAARVGRLLASTKLRDVRPPTAFVDKCIETTTDADIERTQGGPGWRAR